MCGGGGIVTSRKFSFCFVFVVKNYIIALQRLLLRNLQMRSKLGWSFYNAHDLITCKLQKKQWRMILQGLQFRMIEIENKTTLESSR